MDKPTVLGLNASFGFGDRTGLASCGHAKSILAVKTGILPIFAQQSIREMTRTQRTPEQVMADALAGATEAGWKGTHGADADHLKTENDIEITAKAGFCFFTIDPSGEVDFNADNYTEAQVNEKYPGVEAISAWTRDYLGKTITLSTGTKISFDQSTVRKAAVKYGKAIALATRLAKHIAKTSASLGRPHEIELSVDETPQPTTLAEHYIIAEQCLKNGMKLVSLAPRFIGEFEKGVDYKGDLKALEKSLGDHAAIAKQLGPYKLSLHSGSDKLSIYPILARQTKGCFHVKTAGTSYLEMLRVVAHCDKKLFRELIDFSRGRYDTDKATYHVSATLASAPAASSSASDKDLEKAYLGLWSDVPAGAGFVDPGRQILHCTFGSVLTDAKFKKLVVDCVKSNRKTYDEILVDHFVRHLKSLASGM